MSDDRRQLVIVGAGGHGRELLDLVEAINAVAGDVYHFLGFLDDGEGRDGGRGDSTDAVTPDPLVRRGSAVLGGLDVLARLTADYLIGVSGAAARARIDRYASICGRRPATLVHPLAYLGGDVKLGPGTVVCALASLTTNIETGRHVLIDVGAGVSHDCRLGDYATLASGARLGGAVDIGPGAWVGMGASVVRDTRIGAGAVVGAGAIVTADVGPGLVVAGAPAGPSDPADGSTRDARPAVIAPRRPEAQPESRPKAPRADL